MMFTDPSGHSVDFSQNQYDYLHKLSDTGTKGQKAWANDQLKKQMAYIDSDTKKVVAGCFDCAHEDKKLEITAVAVVATCIISCPAVGLALLGITDVATMGVTTSSIVGGAIAATKVVTGIAEITTQDIKVIGRLPDTKVAASWGGHDVLGSSPLAMLKA